MRFVVSAAAVAVLAVSSLASAATFSFSSAGDVAGFSTDRYAPGVFAVNTTQFNPNGVLQQGIRAADVQASSFYNYQGKSVTLPTSGSTQGYSIDLFVDSAGWAGKTINAGVWGVGHDSSNAISAYPIVAYRQSATNAFTAGFYSFDYIGSNGWQFLTAAGSGWNTLALTLNVGVGVDYAVNGSTIGATFADTDTVGLDSVILNAFNSGVDYDVYWDNLASISSASSVPLPASSMGGLALAGMMALRRKRKA